MPPDDDPVPPPPKLPDVETESTDDILARAPSPEEIVEAAEPAEDVIASQPGVDELLGRDRDDSRRAPKGDDGA
ncbi:MAG TPA: hypothetical protein VFG42_25290 [Baekduia sp.]|uniref:hypothetical protein n=1 Tax=Baekduia sp. TaxID=2600305 RepID=UPI002D76E9B8|nr:hypothetical protein [Baekduia sp.]HET6510131.1 hypothetical protein [Baekduia sp.]